MALPVDKVIPLSIKETVGVEVYPEPPAVTFIPVILPAVTVAVAVAPVPEPLILTVGGFVES